MPTRKITPEELRAWAAFPPPCEDPDHDPPGHIMLEPGALYRHDCPGCGNSTVFRGPDPRYRKG